MSWVAVVRAIRIAAAAWAAGRHHALVVGPRSHLPPRDDEGILRGARRVHPALRHRRPRWVRAADAADEVRGSHRPLWLSTLDAISTELVSDSLVHRYKAAASPDGLEGDEATFPLCSFCTSPRWRVPVASIRPASRHLALIRPVLISPTRPWNEWKLSRLTTVAASSLRSIPSRTSRVSVIAT
jgi:hypothetical protein